MSQEASSSSSQISAATSAGNPEVLRPIFNPQPPTFIPTVDPRVNGGPNWAILEAFSRIVYDVALKQCAQIKQTTLPNGKVQIQAPNMLMCDHADKEDPHHLCYGRRLNSLDVINTCRAEIGMAPIDIKDPVYNLVLCSAPPDESLLKDKSCQVIHSQKHTRLSCYDQVSEGVQPEMLRFTQGTVHEKTPEEYLDQVFACYCTNFTCPKCRSHWSLAYHAWWDANGYHPVSKYFSDISTINPVGISKFHVDRSGRNGLPVPRNGLQFLWLVKNAISAENDGALVPDAWLSSWKTLMNDGNRCSPETVWNALILQSLVYKPRLPPELSTDESVVDACQRYLMESIDGVVSTSKTPQKDTKPSPYSDFLSSLSTSKSSSSSEVLGDMKTRRKWLMNRAEKKAEQKRLETITGALKKIYISRGFQEGPVWKTYLFPPKETVIMTGVDDNGREIMYPRSIERSKMEDDWTDADGSKFLTMGLRVALAERFSPISSITEEWNGTARSPSVIANKQTNFARLTAFPHQIEAMAVLCSLSSELRSLTPFLGPFPFEYIVSDDHLVIPTEMVKREFMWHLKNHPNACDGIIEFMNNWFLEQHCNFSTTIDKRWPVVYEVYYKQRKLYLLSPTKNAFNDLLGLDKQWFKDYASIRLGLKQTMLNE